MLETCLKTVSNTFIIIDGLDECSILERQPILSFFNPLIKDDDIQGKLRALFVSQDEDDIRKLLATATSLRLTETHNKSDIEDYTMYWIPKIKEKFGLASETVEYTKTRVCEGSEGGRSFQLPEQVFGNG
jgi:hypothetical protein